MREGPGRVRRDGDQGGTAGGVRDRRGAGRAGIPARARSAARRERTSTRRAARNCWSRSGTRRNGGTRPAGTTPAGSIDRADWLDIRQRTEDDISTARREYDRLSGSATVMSDIPPSERVRDAWESWSTDRRRAAIRAVLHRVLIKPLPAGRQRQRRRQQQEHGHAPRTGNGGPAAARRIRLARVAIRPRNRSGGDESGDRLRRLVFMPLVCSCGVFFRCAAAGGHHARARRAPRPLPGPQCAPGNRARPGSAAHRPRRPAGSRRAPGR